MRQRARHEGEGGQLEKNTLSRGDNESMPYVFNKQIAKLS